MKNIPIAVNFLKYIKENIPVKHPLLLEINKIELVDFYGKPKSKKADVQNMVVLGEDKVDRSPCGIAKLATLYSKGELSIGESFVHEIVLQTKFKAEILQETKCGPYQPIIPQITGNAYITGFNQLFINSQVPLKYGLQLKK